MFIRPHDRVRVRIDFSFNGIKFKEGQWLTGHLCLAGGVLRFEDDVHDILFVPDYFDRFDIQATTLTDTLGINLGRAEDRDYHEFEGPFDDDEAEDPE